MSGFTLALVIAGLTLVTLATRSLFLLLGDGVALPARIRHGLRYAPACALPAPGAPRARPRPHRAASGAGCGGTRDRRRPPPQPGRARPAPGAPRSSAARCFPGFAAVAGARPLAPAPGTGPRTRCRPCRRGRASDRTDPRGSGDLA